MKEYLAIFLSLLVGIYAHHEVHLVPADKFCPDVSPEHNILLPDPHDCSVFYKCENGIAVPQSCPPGLQWCQILQNCTLPILANCTLSHTVVTYSPEELVTYNPNVTTTENPETTGPVTSEETCPYNDIVLPDTKDCSKYYKCVNGLPSSQDCPEGKHFSTWLGICVAPEIANCIYVGTQDNKTCPVNGAKRVHPYDCSKYYECVESTVESKQCPSGTAFNKWFNDCYSSELAHCHSYTTVSPTTSPTTINTPVVDENLCPETGAKLPNPLDCTTYYNCVGDTPTLEHCPDGFEYSCWDQECVPPSGAQCLAVDGHDCNDPKQKLPNAQDCGSYFVCTNGVTTKVECENGLQYNAWFKECVNSSLAHCTEETTTTPIPTTSPTNTPTPSEPNDICPIEGALLPDLSDCHSYYVCKNEIPVKQNCPEGMEYSCWDQECLPAQSANCVDQINKTDDCGKMNNATMPNPDDCSSYYRCVNGEVVLETCENNLEFNAWFGKCVEDNVSHCKVHTTTPQSTPTGPVTPTKKPPSILCPVIGLIYPAQYCNAYRKCDDDRQLVTIICDPPHYHYNCETKKCENIDHCCSPSTITMPPVTDENTPVTGVPTGPDTPVTGDNTPVTGVPTGPDTPVTDDNTPVTGVPTGPDTPVTGDNTPVTGVPTGPDTPVTDDNTPVTGVPTGPDTPVTGDNTPVTGVPTGPDTPVTDDNTPVTGVPTGPDTPVTGDNTPVTGVPTGPDTPVTGDNTPVTGVPTGPDTPVTGDNTPVTGVPTGPDTPVTGDNTPVTGVPTGPDTPVTGDNTPVTGVPTGPDTPVTGDNTPVTGVPTGPDTPVTGDNTPVTGVPTGPDTPVTGDNTPVTGVPTGPDTPVTGDNTPVTGVPTGPDTPVTGDNTPVTGVPTGPDTPVTGDNTPVTGIPTGPDTPITGDNTPVTGVPTGPDTPVTGDNTPVTGVPTGPDTPVTGDNTPVTGVPTGPDTPVTGDNTPVTGVPTGPDTPVTDDNTPVTGVPTGPDTPVTGDNTPVTGVPTGPDTPVTGDNTPVTGVPTGPDTPVTGDNTPVTGIPTGPVTPTKKPTSPSILCPMSGLIYPAKYCNAYRKCDDDRQLVTIICDPPHYHYNCETKKCENIDHCCSPTNVTMPPSETPTTNTPTTITTIKPSPSPTEDEDVCPFDGAKLPNLIDCTSYYVCRNNTPVSESCPTGQEYSCWDQTCKDPNDATCVKNTQPGQTCSNNGDQLPNIRDCSSYYKCENGKSVLMHCALGSFYNKWFEECGSLELSHCTTYPPSTEPGTTLVTQPTTIPPNPTENVCPLEGAKLPNPMDCTTYYVCIKNDPTLKKCPTGQEYSCWDQECVISQVAHCITATHPGDSCSVDNLLLPSIEDCNSYYECQNGTIVSKKCTSGMEFNSWFGKCVDTKFAHCQSSTTSSSTPTTITTQSTVSPSTENDVCPIEGAKLPNPLDCTSYFICVNETAVKQVCPDGQEYSCWDQRCEKPENATCIKEGSQEEKPCSNEGEQQQTVEDCGSYYQCVHGKIKRKRCPHRTMYNRWFRKCMSFKLAHCETHPTIKPPTGTLVPPETTISPSPDQDVCPFEGASLPNPLNCSNYFVCENNEPQLVNCPSGEGYSCWNQRCEADVENQCNPNGEIDQKCSVEGLILPNTEDCEGYLECQHGKIVKQSCPSGTEFNQWFVKCLENKFSHCKPATTLTPPETETCPLDGMTLPNPLDCNSYFTCDNGKIVSKKCLAGEIYSCWDQKCEIPEHATCINQGHQTGHNCSNSGEVLPNIDNCGTYYECVNGKIETKTCAQGTIFNEWHKSCVSTDSLICITYPTVTVPTLPPVTNPTSPNPTYDVCPLEDSLLPNPLDCTTYYKCIHGTPTLQKCPDGNKYSCWDQQCEPDSDATCISVGSQNGGKCEIKGLKLTDVTNCNNYYECIDGTIILRQCPAGKEFNAAFNDCYTPLLSHCHTYSTIEPPETSDPIQPTNSTPTTSDTCPNEGALLPNPLNCSAYYKCVNGTPTPQLCADNYEYSCWNQECEPAGEAKCISDGNQNGASCKNHGQKMENPADCHSYYQCVNNKVELKKCFWNWYYNRWFRICVPISILAHCSSGNTPRPPITPKPTKPPVIGSDICPIDGALLPNPLDCTGYYKCVNDEPTAQTCPSGQLYSCWDQKCEEASDSQCINVGVQLGKNCSLDGVKLQDVENCASYYQCVNGIVEKKYCFIGFQYNKWYQKCVLLPFAHCKTSHITKPTPTPTVPTIATPSDTYDVCPIEGALLPNPIDCTSYYKCINGTPTVTKCGDGQEYSCWDQKCEPDTDANCISVGSQLGANCTVEGLRLANIQDCSSYYECEKGTAVLKHCSDGLEFNDRFKKCYVPKESHCQTYSTQAPTTGTPTQSTNPTPEVHNDICPQEGTLLPNPVNCSLYYKCINGTPTPQQCADGYEYSCWDQQCEPADQAQCINEGTPPDATCERNGQKMPDPTNCRNYIQCVKHKQVKKECPPNLYYNKWFTFCVFELLAHCNETTTIKPKPTIATTLSPPSDSTDTCPHENAVLPNPTDCSTYYKCEKKKPTLKKCPKDQKYSVWDQECKKESEAQCVNVGSPLGKNCSRDGVTIQNLESCTSFYKCQNGIVQQHYCFIAFQYNKWYQDCLFTIFSHCKTYSTVAAPTTTTVAPMITTKNPGKKCPKNKVKVPDVNNCNNYYLCDKKNVVQYNCPHGTNYDSGKENCMPVAEAQCATNSQNLEGQSCLKDKQTIPDPNNCRNYYICENKKLRKAQCSWIQKYSVWEEECRLSILATCVNNM